MRKSRKFLAVFSLLFASPLIATLNGHAQTSYTWSAAGQMTQSRTGAAAVLLSDGKLLITGGSDSNGVPQASTEVFDPAAGKFSPAAPMNTPRANHAAIALTTGDVLVTGGLTTGGGYSDTAEIFSAQTGTWTLLEASLGAGLAKHAMAALSDGNVLIIGGESTTGPVLNLLLFKLADQSITPIGALITARSDAAAAATPDGRVLIAGGTDINGAVLISTEIFTYSPDTMTGTVAAGPNLTYPRTNATATTTYDGVAVIGGSNGTADLGSAEIFSQWTNLFRVVNGATPRSGHIAALLPKNGSILAMGGTGGTAVDLLQPWANNLAGAFLTGAPSTSDHTSGIAAPASLGTLLAAGGAGSSASAAELYWFPTISTDQPDYAPGTPVVMTGVGFKPGETVNLYLREYVNKMLVDPPDYTTTADSTGSFSFMDYAPTPSDLGARYHLTATGTTSGMQAQTIFTDSNPKQVTISAQAPTPVPAGAMANYNVNVSNAGNNNACIVHLTISGLPAGVTSNFPQDISVPSTGGVTLTLTTPPSLAPSAGYSFTVSGSQGSGSCSGNGPTPGTGTLAVSTPVATTTSINAPSISYGQDGSVTVTVSSLSGTPIGNVSLTFNGGSAVSKPLSGGSYTFTKADIAGLGLPSASSYSLTANYSAQNGFAASSTSGSLTVSKATATVVVTSYSLTYDGHSHTAAITSITGVNGETGATVGTVDVSNTTHTNAGTYAADFWTFTGTANYNNIAATTISDKIDKANATVVVTPYSVPYDGSSHSATVTSITGVNGETGATVGTVDVSNTTHTNAGTYAVDSWSFTGSANYNNIAATTISDKIDKATATVVVTPYSVTYDGHSHTAAITSITGVNGETGVTVGTVDVSNTTHTNAGTYASDSWAFTGTANYNNIAATTISDKIDKATATVVVTPYSVTYDGHSHTAAITSITGVNGETGATVGTVDVSNTTHTNAGTYASDSWTFTPTANYDAIAPTTITDKIDKATATVVVTPYTVTYDGSAHSATVTSITGVNGETGATVGTVDVSNTTHTNAGTYAADFWTFTPTANYDAIAPTTITDRIDKATANVVVAPYTVTYDGSAHSATVTSITGVNGETGATVGTVSLNTTHTNAGTYSTDSWSFTGAANYNNIAATTITDTINKAEAIVVVAPYTVTYDGSAHSATVTSITGVNGETGATVGTVSLNTTHTNAGTYSTDSWSFSGANYNDIGPITISDTVSKADATVVVTPYSVTYDGSSHSATVTSITGVNGETGVTVGTVALNTTHTNAETYSSDSWSFSGANYKDIGPITISDTINKANATVIVTPYTVTYDGQAHTATASITGVNGETGSTVGTVDLSNTTHTGAGTYSNDSWSFSGANYNSISATPISDIINKANATVLVTPYTVTYDGQAHTATASITGVNGETGAMVGTVDLSNTSHTNAATYSTDSWSFSGANYNTIAATSITDTISKATATVVVTPYTVTYDGQAHTATASINGVNGETGATVGAVTLNTTHTGAGTYSTDSWYFSGAANYNNISATTITDTINKADATVVVTPYTVTYDGSAHSATVTSITGVNGETGATVGTVSLNTTHTNAGTYSTDSWSFTGAINYKDIGTTTITDIINRANATITVTPYSVFYDGMAHTATVTSIIGVNGESGSTVGSVNVSNTTHTNPGTYSSDSWTFTGTTNYNDIGATTITDVIKHWTVTGFYSPVAPTPLGSSTSIWNAIKGGSTVPLKFNIYAGTVQQTSTTAVKYGSVVVYPATCVSGVVNTATDILTDTGATSLRYDTTGLQFIQNWKTPKGSACYVAQMTAADGTMIQAFFTAN